MAPLGAPPLLAGQKLLSQAEYWTVSLAAQL